ncbi:MAG: hypothetical protein AAF752_12430 [Bacteroidota bacterium]
MASTSRSAGVLAAQVVLGLAIVGLAYFLYVSITEPYQVVREAERMEQLTRERMDDVRTILRAYYEENDRFPSTLDSLVVYAKTDPAYRSMADSLFQGDPVPSADSLATSPRTGKRFEYSVNDTSRVSIYLLKDPDSEDAIGSELPDVTQLHAANWE